MGEVGSVLWGSRVALPREDSSFNVNDSRPVSIDLALTCTTALI